MAKRLVSPAARWADTQQASFLQAIFDALPGAVGYWDRDLFCRCANMAFFDYFGKRPDEVLGTHYRDLLNEQFYLANEPHIRKALAGSRVSFERTLRKADGDTVYLFVNYLPDIDESGTVAGFCVQVSDVTKIKQAEAQVEIGAAVFRATADGIIVTDAAGTILSANPAFTEITGFSADEAVGATPRILRSDQHDAEFFAALWRDLTACGRWQGEIWNRRKNGEVFITRQTISRIVTGDGRLQYVSVFSDITELWRSSERMRHLAFHDELTDLPNRAILIERIGDEIAQAERRGGSGFAIMFIDLDGFKAVNDTLGHDAGDMLLRTVARQLQSIMRRTDLVARAGGDEFVALLRNVEAAEPLARIAGAIVKAINEPLQFNGMTAQVGVSIGISLFPAHGRTVGELMHEADAAMYAAKAAGKNTYRFALV